MKKKKKEKKKDVDCVSMVNNLKAEKFEFCIAF